MLDRVHVMFSVLAILGLSASAAACSKPDGGTSGSAAATGATASASAVAMAAPDASPVAADTTTGDTPTAGTSSDAAVAASAKATASAAGTAPKASASATGANADLAAANAACGAKGVTPDCPLQAWMKANTNSAVATGDLAALATALDKSASFAPAGYANWAAIAKDGAKAAKGGDMTAAKASCRTCHDQYKTKYKAELRGRKI